MFQPSQQRSENITRGDIERHLILKAWEDEAFKQELLSDPKAVWLQEFPISLSGVEIEVLEETPTTLYLVIPAQDDKFKQELLHNPKAVWKREFGTTRLEGRAIRVYEETTNQLYLVLPENSLATIPGSKRLPSKSTDAVEKKLQNIQVTSQFGNLQSDVGRTTKRYRSEVAKVMPKGKLGRILYLSFTRLGLGRFSSWLVRPLNRFQNIFNWLR